MTNPRTALEDAFKVREWRRRVNRAMLRTTTALALAAACIKAKEAGDVPS